MVLTIFGKISRNAGSKFRKISPKICILQNTKFCEIDLKISHFAKFQFRETKFHVATFSGSTVPPLPTHSKRKIAAAVHYLPELPSKSRFKGTVA